MIRFVDEPLFLWLGMPFLVDLMCANYVPPLLTSYVKYQYAEKAQFIILIPLKITHPLAILPYALPGPEYAAGIPFHFSN